MCQSSTGSSTVLVTSRPPGKSMDAPKHKRPVNPSVSPEVVPGNVEPSNDSLDSPNLFTIQEREL